MSAKIRLDALLVQRGLVGGRDRAKGYIMAGQVYVDNQKADKPGMVVADDCQLELRVETLHYVSRGGLKLEKALNVFKIDLHHAVCADIGASTGGFTDCMLQNGAAHVYAVDVGYGQLAWSLRNDERVTVLERTNIRHVTIEQIPQPLDFVSVDVSFISLKLVLPVVNMLLRDKGKCVCLIKPQFEAGRSNVGKKGVVRDKDVHLSVVRDIAEFSVECGFSVLGINFSPVKGPEGNIEYLMYIKKSEAPENLEDEAIIRTITESHMELDNPDHREIT